jgi:hypothetical protein
MVCEFVRLTVMTRQVWVGPVFRDADASEPTIARFNAMPRADRWVRSEKPPGADFCPGAVLIHVAPICDRGSQASRQNSAPVATHQRNAILWRMSAATLPSISSWVCSLTFASTPGAARDAHQSPCPSGPVLGWLRGNIPFSPAFPVEVHFDNSGRVQTIFRQGLPVEIDPARPDAPIPTTEIDSPDQGKMLKQNRTFDGNAAGSLSVFPISNLAVRGS